MPRIPRHAMARCAASAALAAAGVLALVSVGTAISRSGGDADSIIFLSAFGLVVTMPWLLGAYFCLRRQYLNLLMVGASVVALIGFGLLASLPRWIGMDEVARKSMGPWQNVRLLVVSLAFLLGPFYAA